jgi:hypothetical protein
VQGGGAEEHSRIAVFRQISLNFFNRNDRNACLIGSTDLDLASLPPHPYTLL